MRIFRRWMNVLCLGAGVLAARSILEAEILEKDAIKVPLTVRGISGVLASSPPAPSPNVTIKESPASATVVCSFGSNANPIHNGAGQDWAPILGKEYQLSIAATNVGNLSLEFDAPPGHTVYIADVQRSKITWNYWYEIPLSLKVRVEADSASPFGAPASLRPGRIVWSLGMGNLLGGRTAGIISLRQLELGSDAFTPAALNYDTFSPQVERIFQGAAPRQIYAAAGLVDITADNNHAFRLKFYARGTGQIGSKDGSGCYVLTGDPLYEYIVENPVYPTINKKLRITKIVRQGGATQEMWTELENLSTSNPPSPAGPYSVTDWVVKPSGASSVVGPVQHVLEGNITYTGDPITTAFSSTSPSYAVYFQRRKTLVYTTQTWGPELASAAAGNYGHSFSYANKRVVQQNRPHAYPIYTSYNSDNQVYQQFTSFASSGASPTQPNLGEVTTTLYSADWTGRAILPQSITTNINGTLARKAEISYSYEDLVDNSRNYSSTANATMKLIVATRKDYYSTSNYLTTVTKTFRDDCDPEGRVFPRLPHSVKNPDGSMTVTLYYRGALDVDLRQFVPNRSGPGPELLVLTLKGTTLSSPSAVQTTSYAIAPPLATTTSDQTQATEADFYLVPNISTADAVIQGADGTVIAKVSLLYSNSGWHITQRDVFHYTGDMFHVRTSRDRGVSTASYDVLTNGWTRGLLDYTTDENAVRTDFTYDTANRVVTKARQAMTALGATLAATTTTYTYDAANNVKSEVISSSGTSETLVTTRTFDDAGRVLTETKPGYPTAGTSTASASITTRSYQDVMGGNIVTTAPCGCTTTEAFYYDGRKKSITGDTVAEYYDYSIESNGSIKTRAYKGTNNGPRYTESWADMLGRPVKKNMPGFTGQVANEEENFYDGATGGNTGRLIKTTKTGLAATLYEYNTMSQVVRSGQDINANGILDVGGMDRITDVSEVFELSSSQWFKSSTSVTYPYSNSSSAVQTSKAMTQLTFPNSTLRARSISYDADNNATTTSVEFNATSKILTTQLDRPGIASAYERSLGGLVLEKTGHDRLTSQLRYDALLRLEKEIEPRTGTQSVPTILTVYHPNTTWVKETRDPLNVRLSFTHYDAAHRPVYSADALGRTTRTSYNNQGKIWKVWGSATYPVEYVYNEFGDRTKLRTYRDPTNASVADTPTFPSAGSYDETTWEYDAPSGLLKKKIDAQSKFVEYSYNQRGQINQRFWSRTLPGSSTRVTASYVYDGATGELTAVNYNDATPSVTYGYMRSGQTDLVTDAAGTHDFTYDPATPWRQAGEIHDSFYNNRVVTRTYETVLSVDTGETSFTGHSIGSVPGRLSGVKVGTSSDNALDMETTYFTASTARIAGVRSRASSGSIERKFAYGYEPNSSLVKSMSVVGGQYSISRDFESTRDLVTNVEAKWSTTSRTRYSYVYNDLRQRQSVVQSGDVFADYGGSDQGATHQIFTYNGRGELTVAATFLGATAADQSSPLSARRHEFDYDGIGNRRSSNTTGVSGLRDNYSVNSLNQYTAKDNNTLAVGGTADADALVAARLTGLAGRAGRHWGDSIVLPNAYYPFSGPLKVHAVKPGTGGAPYSRQIIEKTATLPAMHQTFVYDADGNLTADGVWTYEWDAENRLRAMQITDLAAAGGYARQRLEFKYDHLHRRVEKVVKGGWNGASYTTTLSTKRFLYNGWNVLLEFAVNSGTFSVVRSYTWGLDIARSLVDAGGVGALLQIRDHAQSKDYFPSYDGNGNIAALFDSSSGSVVAAYEYSPYGEFLRCEGTYAKENPFRFSTKFTDDETGLVYYGRRYYSASQGRFLGRDPKGEAGGKHLYGFTENNPVNRWDYLGMATGPVQMPTYAVNGGRREQRTEEGDDGCLYEVYYQDMSPDPAYGFEEMQEVGRVKISCPKSSDDDLDAAIEETKRRECGEISQQIALAESVVSKLLKEAEKKGWNFDEMYDKYVKAPGQWTGYAKETVDLAYLAAKVGLDASGLKVQRKALTAAWKAGSKYINGVEAVTTSIDGTNILMDIKNRDGMELMGDAADTTLGFMTTNPWVLGGRVLISGGSAFWQHNVDKREEKSIEQYKKNSAQNVALGEAKLQGLRARSSELGCK